MGLSSLGLWSRLRSRRWLLARGGGLLADLLLPPFVAILLVQYLLPTLVGNLDRQLAAADIPAPSDSNGTIWFYQWMHLALRDGKNLLHPDIVCAPAGQALGENFPNRMDAWLAQPFFAWYDMPRAYNLALLAVPVWGSVVASWMLRMVGIGRAAALFGGLFYGFNATVFHEMDNGRLATALIPWYPLFLGPWLAALRTPGWKAAILLAILGGVAGAISIHAYAPGALFLAIAALGSGAFHLAFPPQGVSRVRPLAVGLLAAVLGGVLGAPYVHEIQVIRASEEIREPLPPWSPQLWRELAALPHRGHVDPDHVAFVQRNSLPWDWPRAVPKGVDGDRSRLSQVLLGAGVLAAAFGGKSARTWGAAAFCFYLFSLGPYACERVDPVARLSLWGYVLKLPTGYLMGALPEAGAYLRPYRLVPLVLLCLLGAMAAATQQLSGVVGALVERASGRAWLGRAAGAMAVAVLLLAVGAGALREIRGTLSVTLYPWQPPGAVAWIAAQPGDFAVVELPLGAGHSLSLYQVIHGKRVSEPHHDVMPAVIARRTPPACYRGPLVSAFWDLGREGWSAAAEEALTAAAVERAKADGYRFVVLFLRAFEKLFPRGEPFDRSALVTALNKRFGAPVYRDWEGIVWALR